MSHRTPQQANKLDARQKDRLENPDLFMPDYDGINRQKRERRVQLGLANSNGVPAPPASIPRVPPPPPPQQQPRYHHQQQVQQQAQLSRPPTLTPQQRRLQQQQQLPSQPLPPPPAGVNSRPQQYRQNTPVSAWERVGARNNNQSNRHHHQQQQQYQQRQQQFVAEPGYYYQQINQRPRKRGSVDSAGVSRPSTAGSIHENGGSGGGGASVPLLSGQRDGGAQEAAVAARFVHSTRG